MKDLIGRYNAIDAMCDNCDTKTAECAHYPCCRYEALLQYSIERWMIEWNKRGDK